MSAIMHDISFFTFVVVDFIFCGCKNIICGCKNIICGWIFFCCGCKKVTMTTICGCCGCIFGRKVYFAINKFIQNKKKNFS